jgi:hypothetical protein
MLPSVLDMAAKALELEDIEMRLRHLEASQEERPAYDASSGAA